MEPQLAALREIEAFLDAHSFKYVVIGGIANAIWGRPRFTHDVDFKVLLGERPLTELVTLIVAHFQFRVSEPESFARRTYVLPIYATNQIPVDLGVGFFPYEELAVDRAVVVAYQDITFPVCTAEDLIIHKAISERAKDWEDIEGVLIRQSPALDQAYILEWLEQFAQALERPELIARYQQLVARCRNIPDIS